VNVLPLAHPEDVRELPDETKRAVVALLRRLPDEPDLGKVLDPAQSWQRFAAPLAGLRAAKVPGAYEAEVRVVYRVLDGGLIEVLAIGPRMGSECYKRAASRIVRAEKPRRIRRRR